MSFGQRYFDGMTEALAMGMVMTPPEGFLELAVTRGLAVVEAEEALVLVERSRADQQRSTANDPPRGRRRRHDSGVIRLTPPPPSATPSEPPPQE